MGDAPDVVKITCPGCETQFRLRPKKGKLPKGPVPCPKCADSIPVIEENIDRAGAQEESKSLPQSRVFSKASNGDSARSGTVAGSPSQPAEEPGSDDEFEDISAIPGLSESNPKSTFLGMGSALPAINAGRKDDKTAVVDGDLLAKIRSESSVVEDDEEPEQDPLSQTAENPDVHLRETSEKKAVSKDEAEQEEESEDDDQVPGSQVIGRIKLKKKLKRRLKKKSRKPDEADSEPDSPKTAKKPSLAALLEKARKQKDSLKLPSPKSPTDDEPAASSASSDEFDEALDELVDETARALDEPMEGEADEATAVGEDEAAAQQPPAYDVEDSSMIDLLRRRVAENQQPGAASERRGSGYIRLPTAEIQEVLGQGTYRLRVEEIVYEPVDQQGLTELIKRGVLLGAEEIAEDDGDWMPIADHPVFQRLRRKMAREAHDLLAQYGSGDASDEQADLPTPAAELPTTKPPELPTTAGDEQEADEDIPMLDAELEQEAEDAAQDLFADGPAPATGPADPAPATPDPAPDPAPAAARASSPEASPPQPSTDDVQHPADDELIYEEDQRSSSTWVPILAGVAVLGALVALVALDLVPIDLPSFGETAEEATPSDSTSVSEADDASAELTEAVGAAAEAVSGALQVNPSDPALQQAVASELVDAGDHRRAARVMRAMWPERRDDADFAASFADTLIDAGQFADARSIAVAGMQMDSLDHDFEATFRRSISQNPALGAYDTIDISVGEHADRAATKPYNKQVFFGLQRDDKPGLVFKASQDGWEDGWRFELAAWRLCQMIVCNFEVPPTRPARIDRASLEQLVEGDTQSLTRLNWTEQDGATYVYGVLQDDIGDAAPFPIEYDELWRPWLSVSSSFDLENAPLQRALSPLDEGAPGYRDAIAGQLGEAALPDIAGQMSSVLVFDFLTNHWSRFARSSDDWGSNLAVRAGTLVSPDNAGTFQPRASTRVRGRFGWTSRFSRDTITSLRAIDREMVFKRLFPDPSAAERARLQVFWSQRQAALERVDALIGQHGRQEVLAFE